MIPFNGDGIKTSRLIKRRKKNNDLFIPKKQTIALPNFPKSNDLLNYTFYTCLSTEISIYVKKETFNTFIYNNEN